MSVRQSELAWELNIPTNLKFVCIELADHANPDGLHVFPSLETIAKRTSQSPRNVRRILRQLEVCPGLTEDEKNAGITEHIPPHLGLIEVVAYRNGGRGMATEYSLHFDQTTQPEATVKADIYDVKADIYDTKGDILSAFTDLEDAKRRTSTTLKADICDIKADILSEKADTGVRPTVSKPLITVRETLGSNPTWFDVLSEIPGFSKSLDECQQFLEAENITSDVAKKLAYSLQDWLSHQTGKALRGDPWLRFRNWAVRDRAKPAASMSSPDKYAAAKDDAKRRD
jgi:hypothetical protein